MTSNIPTVNFLQIINTHAVWKSILNEMLANELRIKINLDPDHLKKDNLCHFGQLIQTYPQRFSALPSFVGVRNLHKNFHGISSEIVRLYQDGQLTKATELLNGRFELVSRNLKSKLILLSQEYVAAAGSF